MTSLVDAFDAAVGRHPDRVAIVDGHGRATSFVALQARSLAFARGFARRGLGAGDRALVAMPVSADLYAALCGLWRIGGVAVFPEPAMGLPGLRHAARTTRPCAFVATSWYRALGWVVPELIGLPAPEAADADTLAPPTPPEAAGALISFTSGSTGRPKAMARSHAFMMAQYRALAPILATVGPDRDLVGFPVVALINLAEGRTSVLPGWRMRNLDRVTGSRVAGWAEEQGVTRVLLPPSLCEVLAAHGCPASLRTVFTGGGPVFPDIVERLAQAGQRVVCIYGSTEAEPMAVVEAGNINAGDVEAMKSGAGLLAGHPVPGIDLWIRDGEILVSGPHVNQGYLDPVHDAESKLADSGRIWHRTGDAGRLDDAGRLWLLGRHGDPATHESCATLAVETAARYWPGVRSAALCATGKGPVLAIVGDDTHADTWRRHAAEFGIAEVQLFDRLPMDRRHGSKIDRAQLKKRVER